MSTFLYSPGVKAYIDTDKHGVIDVSNDLTSGQLSRRSDGVSTFSFSLQNPRRKYDQIFTPNDRIIVMMKRISWMRVFTGYLNSVPLLTIWPRVVNVTASCSLKRLQYWYWDPALPESQQMVAQAIKSAKGSTDGGVTNAVLTLMDHVVGWPVEKIHIGGIPDNWFDFAYKIAKDVQARAEEADQIAEQFYATLGAGGAIGGISNGGGTVASGALKAGTYGGVHLNQTQANNAVIIYNVGKQTNATNRDIAVALMAAMQESRLTNDKGGDRDSAGLFQMRPSMGWGTYAQVTDPQYASKKFYSVLLRVKNRNSMSMTQEAQAVERSATPSAYAQWKNMAVEIVNVLSKGSAAATLGSSGDTGSSQFNNQIAKTKTGTSTGPALLETALSLVKSHPHIPYQLGGDSADTTSNPTKLDCSSFVQWCYYHTVGKHAPRTSQQQSSWCKSSGKIISAAQGMKTQGALMFRGGVGAAHHVEISVGDGKHTVGAHHSGTYAGVISSSASYWDEAGLPPNLAYNGNIAGLTGGDSSGPGQTTPIFQIGKASEAAAYNSNNEFDKLFGDSPWVITPDTTDYVLSEALGGIRALLNDQPLLPYLKNLFNSTLRSFCSAPNGDLIAWFPDYYGIWGTAAKMIIEPIECLDFNVEWSDDFFVTHQYTTDTLGYNAVDLGTGTVQGVNPNPLLAVTTDGIATIDIPAIMYGLFGLEADKQKAQDFISYVYKRFGARPDYQQMPGVMGPSGEFFSALFLFMRQWAYQYNADVQITFMPELWPGMLIQLPWVDFQAYVTTVTHSFQFGPDGGFQTTVNIAAPSRLPKSEGDRSGALIGLPIAGGLGPDGT